ncbi:MAG: methyl-accepting chemotaxis protein, partial [Acidaminobacteraceae bacterium]
YKVFLLESEYFRTNDEKIFKKIPSESATFKNLLNKVEITDEAKGKIRTGLTKYNSKIQLVNSLNKSVYNDRFGSITKYREKGNAIIDQINSIYINVSQSALASLNASRMSITTIILVSVALTLFVAVLMTTTIVKPINDTKELVKDIAEGEGDLTHTFDINGTNEMEQMKGSINIFVSKIRGIIIGVKGTSLTLSESSSELSKAVEEANIHIEEISTEVVKISEDLISTSNYVVEVNSAITDMTTSASIITAEAINVSSNSLEIIEAANRGSSLINEAASSIDEVKQSSETVNSAISELQIHSKEIGGIIDIIKGISDQTNLLALNASIEAARAGEHGRGFSVVATEVRNLSEETKKSTAKISDLIKKIESVVGKANTNIKKEQDKVNVSVEQTYKAKNEFAVILNMIKELSNKIDYIVAQSENQNNITSEMAASITDILTKTEKNTESSAKISENIESQVSIFEEIGASLEELSAMADILTAETDKFKV